MRANNPSFRTGERLEELAHGQVVIVSARWLLVLLALLLMLWNPAELSTLRIQILFVLMMAFANFYLHAQVLMRRPILPQITYAASAADLIVITILLAVNGGFQSDSYTFYFPAIVAFSVVFPTEVTALYMLGMCSAYTAISLPAAAMTSTVGASDVQVLVARLIIFVAVAVCGNIYWRIERSRRRSALDRRDEPPGAGTRASDAAMPDLQGYVPAGERS